MMQQIIMKNNNMLQTENKVSEMNKSVNEYEVIG